MPSGVFPSLPGKLTPHAYRYLTHTPTPTSRHTPADGYPYAYLHSNQHPYANGTLFQRPLEKRSGYASGDYEAARFEFDALLADPGADAHERRLALHWRGRSELQLGDASAAVASLKCLLSNIPAMN